MQKTPTAHQARGADGQGRSAGEAAAGVARLFMLVRRPSGGYGFTYQKISFNNRNPGEAGAGVRRGTAKRNQYVRALADRPEGIRGDGSAPRRPGARGRRSGPRDGAAVGRP